MSKNQNWEEKFIDKNIAELARTYDMIRGANINIARITPEIYDGLKPVQRRALYIMYLENKGKIKRKLASISGDTFGRVHPHCIHGDTIFATSYGKMEIQNIYAYGKPVEVKSIDIENNSIVSSIMYNVRITKYVDELYMISFKDGGQIKCTNDHSLLLMNNGKSVWVRADEIKQNDIMYSGFTYKTTNGETKHIFGVEVESVDIIKYDQPEPVYDFTVDGLENALSFIDGGRYICVHNSPTSIEDAIVGMEQPWHNNIPLVTGYGNWGTCHSFDTEVLTRHGWKLFKNLTNDDQLGSIDPKTKSLIFEHPTKLISYHYEGKMIVGNHHSIDFMVTPDHKMLISEYHPKNKTFSEFKFVSADKLPLYFKLITNYKLGDKLIDLHSKNVIDNDNKSEIIFSRTSVIHKELYDNMVYCATMPTYHTLITRRNGKILISGNCSGDDAGASRYIHATLSEYSLACFFDDWENAVVDMVMGADEKTREPVYLPAKYPNVLINGCLGIGYGLSSNIPPFNFKEVIESTITLMNDPTSNIVLIPDSPTGASIIEGNFMSFADGSNGSYRMRCTYNIDAENNVITITSVPYLISLNNVRAKIADVKDKGGLSELVDMNDLTDTSIKLQLIIRDDVNPYKFMKKLIKEVSGLEKGYPINLTITNDYETFDYSLREIILRWIQYRREQKRLVVNNRRTNLLAEQRTNDVKIFLLTGNNIEIVHNIFKNGRNRTDIEKKLIDQYYNSEIHMDSLMARTLSNMRMVELSIEAYESYLKRKEEISKELQEVEEILMDKDGIDKVIIAELRDGAKRFGTARKSNVVPYKISAGTEITGVCILQLSSDRMITRKIATNVDQEPIPADSNGFAVVVDNDSSFILIDENAHHSFIRVKDLPVDVEVPTNRYSKQNLQGNIIAMLPVDIEDQNMCCTLITKNGQLKRIRISDIGPSKKPVINLSSADKLVKGVVTKLRTTKDILVFTKNGMGQRFDPNTIKITSPLAKGGNGFKLKDDDEIIGCYAINPEENQYLFYMTSKGKARLNLLEYLTQRDSKHDAMLNLISLNERDKLVAVVGCNKLDKIQVFFDDGSDEIVEIEHIPESTMSSDPKKVTTKNAVTTNVVKIKVL